MKLRSVVAEFWYRGSNSDNPLQMKEDGNAIDEFGPGLYFTDNYSIAAGYGHVRRYEVMHNNLIEGESKIDINKIKEIISYADKEHFTIALSNWDDDDKVAMTMMLDSISQSRDMPEAIIQTYVEVFRGDRQDFLMSCRAADVNGIILTDPYKSGRSSRFLILYNPKLARLVDDNPYEE